MIFWSLWRYGQRAGLTRRMLWVRATVFPLVVAEITMGTWLVVVSAVCGSPAILYVSRPGVKFKV